MKEFLVAVFSMWISFAGNNQSPLPAVKDNLDFRAVKYSIPIDYTIAHDILSEEQGFMPNQLPRIVVAHQYFIQYGKDVVIDILDPGFRDGVNGIFINNSDYSKGEVSLTQYFDHARMYRTIINTFQLSIEESRGATLNLCKEGALNPTCDSVKYISNSGDINFMIYFKDKVPNLITHKLFYPDVKYVPTKIVDLDHSINNTMSLEKVIYGKPAIDSLLQLYSYEGYDLMSEEDLNAIDSQSILEMMDKYRCGIERLDQNK